MCFVNCYTLEIGVGHSVQPGTSLHPRISWRVSFDRSKRFGLIDDFTVTRERSRTYIILAKVDGRNRSLSQGNSIPSGPDLCRTTRLRKATV